MLLPELSVLKDLGPMGVGLLGIYLISKEIVVGIKNKVNGNGISNQLLNHKILDILIELKTQSEKQTGILKQLRDKHE